MRLVLSALIVLCLVTAAARAADPDWKTLYEEQKKRTDSLERRLAILEEKLQAEPYVEKAKVPEGTLKFITESELTGYVSASVFHNFNRPANGENTGRGFDVRNDEFMLNKLMLKLTHPVEFDAFAWRAGYTAEVILGQDAEFTQASGLSLGDQGDLLQAFVEVNAPIGHGLKIGFGKYSTPLGYELTETEQNANWSAGNQWTLLVPFTHTGVSLTYPLAQQWEAQLLVNNGWDVVADNNSAKSFIGRLAFNPSERTSYTLIGYGGPEQDDNSSSWRRGVDWVVSHKWNHLFTTAAQIDYGTEDDAQVVGEAPDPSDPGSFIAVVDGRAQWWGAGAWVIYTPSEKWDVAFRGDYVNDIDGARTSQAPALAPFEINRGQELFSLTLTVNIKPVEGLKLSPEVRWDHSSLDTAFDGHDDQVTVGFGAVYSF